MEFSRPEYWSRYPLPFAGDLPNPGIESRSPISQVYSLPAEPYEGRGQTENTAQWSHHYVNPPMGEMLCICRAEKALAVHKNFYKDL